MKLELSRQFFERYSNIKCPMKSVQWEPSCSRPKDGRTDEHGVANSRFSQFCGRA